MLTREGGRGTEEQLTVRAELIDASEHGFYGLGGLNSSVEEDIVETTKNDNEGGGEVHMGLVGEE